jgi:SAM-dependent methyltransferase
MRRCHTREIVEQPDFPEEILEIVYRDLARLHAWLGNTAAILRALRDDHRPVRKVLDVGCGRGHLLAVIRRTLGVDVVGVDLRAPVNGACQAPVLQGDAVRTPLPCCDIAVCVCVAHHLSEAELGELIRNVAGCCRRFVMLDLVRHWVPLALFSFLAPFMHRVTFLDGLRSIRRAYTPGELRGIVDRVLEGTGARFRHTVARFHTRQVLDITFEY